MLQANPPDLAKFRPLLTRQRCHVRQTLAEIGRCFDTDKSESPGYTGNYERHLGHLRDKPVRLLELGVYHGGSLLMWNAYFDQGRIVGVDRSPNPLKTLPERVRFYQGSQDDDALLDRIAAENAPEGFDIVIDDAAHIGTLARASFRNLFDKHLKSGGIYVVEDWGTGYWSTWPDGALYQHARSNHTPQYSRARLLRTLLLGRLASWLGQPATTSDTLRVDPNFAAHNYGMVGFVKELIDQVAWGDITRAGRGNSQIAGVPSAIRELTVHHGQVFVVKA